MKVRDNVVLEMHANLCRMMAHPGRLAIVELVCGTERSVGEIAEALGESMSATSQHLRLLKDNNVVTTRKDGQTVYYTLKHPKLIQACHLIREVLLEDLKSRGATAEMAVEGMDLALPSLSGGEGLVIEQDAEVGDTL